MKVVYWQIASPGIRTMGSDLGLLRIGQLDGDRQVGKKVTLVSYHARSPVSVG